MNANNLESPERKLVMWHKCKEKSALGYLFCNPNILRPFFRWLQIIFVTIGKMVASPTKHHLILSVQTVKTPHTYNL